MDDAEAKNLIIETLKSKTNKSKFYLKDFYAFLPDMKKMAVSKLVNTMVAEGTLEYWSSGSTTMIGLKGAGKQHATEEGE
ncbi:dissimilatory sulfite reductase D family protein [Fundidesulfovibrio agrisoli]|uniref:dissimilatory sulfite reductase D family protein n=1 Tax=Fundidesulfovibrio agrisoli TaxID=2922717 RepID=UPI001FABCCF4|nr:dissimilatory sulfite reductase D family protein [Fundidesulfovibrio agrisoli]